jgi:hypothetical protein
MPSGATLTSVASSETPSALTVPTAWIRVPTVTPSGSAVMLICRVKPARSVIMMVRSVIDFTVPLRCGRCSRGPPRSGPGPPASADGAAEPLGAGSAA